MRVADVDGDGIDELVQGGFSVNPKKDMVASAGIGHGDRYRVSDIDPTRPGLEIYAIQQSNLLGQVIYDAATGEHLKEWYLKCYQRRQNIIPLRRYMVGWRLSSRSIELSWW